MAKNWPKFEEHTCSQQATWYRHTNEQQVVFLAGITTENERQQPKIPGWLILFSRNKTLSTALYLTLFFPLMLVDCRMSSISLSFGGVLALTYLKGYDRGKKCCCSILFSKSIWIAKKNSVCCNYNECVTAVCFIPQQSLQRKQMLPHYSRSAQWTRNITNFPMSVYERNTGN